MCYQVVERYAVCKCLRFRHAIDPCRAYGQHGHLPQEKTVLVGYVCDTHAAHRGQAQYPPSAGGNNMPDSGYSSANLGASYRG